MRNVFYIGGKTSSQIPIPVMQKITNQYFINNKENKMKKLLTILLLILMLSLVISCNCNTDCKSLKTQAQLEERNLELVHQMWTEWNNRNIEFFWEVLDSSKYVYYSPANNPNPDPRENIIEGMEKIWKDAPDVSLNVKELMASGDKVISIMTFSFTHSQEYNGIPATGNKIEVSTINIVRIEDGKIIEERESVDTLGFLKQLGYKIQPPKQN